MKQTLSCMILLLLFPALYCAGQTGGIKGRVIDSETGAPLVGATILLYEGQMTDIRDQRTPTELAVGRASNLKGQFTYENVSPGQYTLKVTYIGFRDHIQQITVEAGAPMDILIGLLPDIIGLQEVVVSGAASRTQKEVAEVAVARLNANELTSVQSYNDIGQLLTGKVPGVRVSTTSGNVGGAMKFDVRSGAGLLGGQPVIYVDGVRMLNASYGFGVGGQFSSTLADINPQYIQNIEVLKGPAAAALYGTSGANGVVLISTKQGSRDITVGDYRFWYRATTGWNEQLNEYTQDYARSYQDANAIFRDGSIAEHALGVVGNAGLFNYFLAYENRAEDGILRNSSMHRNSIRANFSAFPSNRLSLDVHTNYTFNNVLRPQNDNNILGPLGNTLLSGPAEVGGYGSYAFTDSVAVDGIETMSNVNHFTGSVQANWVPIDDLVLRGVIGYDGFLNNEDQTYPQNLNYTGVGVINGMRSLGMEKYEAFNLDLSAGYTWQPADNWRALSTLGFQGYQRTAQDYYFQKMDFPSTLITNIGAGQEFMGGDQTYIQFREAGVFFQQDVSFAHTWFFSAGIRNDYVSSVGEEAPSIFYPRASAAVRLDRLDLLPESFNFVKLRAAYGESGILPGVLDGSALRWGGQPSGFGAGAVISSIGNAAIEPERTQELEVGLEAEYDRSYGIDLSYYWRWGNEAIVSFLNPPSTGLTATSVPRNVGAINGWGFESNLYARPIYTKDVQLNLNFIYNFANNEVDDLGGAAPIFSGPNAIVEGQPRSAFYVFAIRGANFDQDGNYAGPVVDTVRSFLGTPVPPHSASFSLSLTLFNDLTIYALLDGAWGGTLWNQTRMFGTLYANNIEYATLATQLGIAEAMGVVPVEGVETLTPGSDAYVNAGNQFARLTPGTNQGAAYYESSDFIRLREISVRYDLTRLLGNLFDKRHVRSLALILSARNLFLSTKYSGPDVDVQTDATTQVYRGVDFLTLQNPRVYNLTLAIGF